MADQAKRIGLIKGFNDEGWMLIMFASKIGLPDDIAVDVLIDNGATSAGSEEATVNALVNVTNAWLWTCEFVAAVTREGRATGILKSATEPGSEDHNKLIQSREGRHWLGNCETPVPAGRLAGIDSAAVRSGPVRGKRAVDHGGKGLVGEEDSPALV